MWKIGSNLQAIWMVVKFIVYVISLFKRPEEAKTIVQKASREVTAVHTAADPKTSLSLATVQAAMEDHMDEINDIINSATFKGIKNPSPAPDDWITSKYGKEKQ